jgi:protoporphyrinogen oxidase
MSVARTKSSPAEAVDCVIVGGGFTGLAAAADLVKAGRKVIVIERDTALGGLAGGFDVGGHELEKFYHHWFTSDTHITDIATQVGRRDRIVTRETRTGMYYSGNFFRLSTPMDLLRFHAIPFFDRIRTGFATLAVRRIKDWRKLEDLSAKDWLIQVFGKTAYRVVWEPLLVGKFGSYAKDISAVWFWNKLALRGGSRGKGGGEELAYYLGGFAQLARDVGDYIQKNGGRVIMGSAVEKVTNRNGQVEIQTSDGTFRATTALVTTPLPHAANMLQDGTSAVYADSLRRIKYLGNVCLILEMNRSLSEIYWLNVNDPSFPFVGIIEHTNFEPKASYGGKHIVYLSKYLPTDDALYSMTSDELFAYALPYIKKMFPDFDPSWVLTHHAWRAPYAQPIVEKHYSKLIPAFETPVEDVFLCTMAQVYPEDRGTNYAVREGRLAAVRILDRLAASPKAASKRVRPLADAEGVEGPKGALEARG